MARCIIHIGMHKTASKSIQQSLDGFEDGRFLYAALGNATNHSLAVYSMFAPTPERHHLHVARSRDAAAVRGYVARMHEDLDGAIAAAAGRTLLISGEDIGVIPPAGLVSMRNYFRKRFADLTIAGYVRPPGSFMASGFQQRVRRGAHKLDMEQLYRRYQDSFGKFDDVFGQENVQLWKFDPARFPQGCAVRDFCARLGIALPDERVVRSNESFSRQAVSALYTYHKLRRNDSKTLERREIHALGALLGGTGSTKFRLSPDVVRPVLEMNLADIQWMSDRLGESLHEALGEHKHGDVRRESDLLNPDPDVVAKLLSVLREAAPEGIRGDTPEEVALLVHAWRSVQGMGA